MQQSLFTENPDSPERAMTQAMEAAAMRSRAPAMAAMVLGGLALVVALVALGLALAGA